MSADPTPEQAELIEAEAYESMMRVAETAGIPGFRAVRSRSGLALVAPGLKKILVFNRVLALGVSEPASEDYIDELAALYAPHELPWAVELSPHACPELIPQWLRDRRIRRGAPSAVLVRSTHDIPEVTTDLEIRPWQPEDNDAGAALAAQTFSVPEEVTALLAALPHAPRWRQWLVLDAGKVVATGLLYLGEGLAWTGWAATQPEYRGLGLHGAIVSARIQDAAQHGCSWVVSDTAIGTEAKPDPSYRNHLRKGFRVVHERHSYLAVPGVVKAA
ncbi:MULTISPECIES: GNAT family N-acetyltransferase [unclassified Thioalkalivibrio]|uniref:GNAT family N-acetyltransferase n=1 Tax=unclassified Thioalkalivibrio TaxID=2621013 RepID=UPI0003765E63|nr:MULTISPECIES: GNAT family N-acetyltransferase [unclassified Thioalkalivibrio]